jgi:hypothetical protein
MSCGPKENELCPKSQLKGKSNCITNYKPWFNGFGYLYKGENIFTLSLGQIDENCNSETIVIKSNQLTIGKLKLNFSVSALGNLPTSKFDTVHGQDAQTEQYDLKKDFENIVEITSINKDTTLIKGKFDLAYVISENSIGKTDINRPDTLYFKEGVFELILNK